MNAEKSGDVGRVMIVAITDGRANVPLKRSLGEVEGEEANVKPSQQELKVGDTMCLSTALWPACCPVAFMLTSVTCGVQDEILEIAGKIYKSGMSLLVIDSENKFISTGFAKEIARVAQGMCVWPFTPLSHGMQNRMTDSCLRLCREILLSSKCI